jgi:hypothetical protein
VIGIASKSSIIPKFFSLNADIYGFSTLKAKLQMYGKYENVWGRIVIQVRTR